MNQNTLNAAVKRHKDNPTREAISADEKGFTPEEVEEILAAINATPKGPDLSEFDYLNLNGEAFAKYQAIALNMPADQETEYEQYMASGVFEWGFNKRTGDKEEQLVGISLKSTLPINVTKIPNGYARLMNEQVYSKMGDSNSRYYLLKK